MFVSDIFIPCGDGVKGLSEKLVIFVEPEYSEALDDFIQKNYRSISRRYTSQGLQFIYLPRLAEEVGSQAMQYIGNSQGWQNSPIECFREIIPDEVLHRIFKPCLVHYVPNKGGFYVAFFDVSSNNPDVFDAFLKLNAFIYAQRPHFEQELYSLDSSAIHDEKLCEGSEHFVDDDIHNIAFPNRRARSNRYERQKEDICYANVESDLLCGCGLPDGVEEEEKWEIEEESFEEIEGAILDKENKDLIRQVRALMRQLERRGISMTMLMKLSQGIQKPEPLVVEDGDIYLGHKSKDTLVKLTPLDKAFYILYLRHPEGIAFKGAVDYKDELLRIYRVLATRGKMSDHQNTITNFIDPTRDLMSVSASHIKNAFNARLAPELAKHYLLQGKAGELRRIVLDHNLIRWNDHWLNSQI